jgi:hypothetical protein
MGIFIDCDLLRPYKTTLEGNVAKIRSAIYEAKKSIITQINAEKLADIKVPEQYTKTGKVSANWTKYITKMKRIEANGPLVTEETPKPLRKYIANLGSVPDKQRILYDRVDYYQSRPADTKKNRPGRIMLTALDLELDLSKTGGLPTGKAAIMATQGADSPLDLYNKEVKKLQFTVSTLAKVVPETSRIHLPVSFPGTLTLRLSGAGGLNLQNLCKDAGFLSAWRSQFPHKYLIVQADFTALEPYVLTEMSNDAAMKNLYGPNAPKDQDVYIYCAALCGGDLGQPFLDLGYNPYAPTKESIALCKKQLKQLRNAAKIVVLSDDYGSGVEKKQRTLKLSGIHFTMNQMRDIQARLDSAFRGKKQFGEKLQREWIINRGYVLDGLGLPVAVSGDKLKDITNRVIQRTGHMILQLFLYKITQEFHKAEIDYSFLVADFHDEVIPIVAVDQVEQVKAIYKDALVWLNKEVLHSEIELKAVPQIAVSLAEIKVEGFKESDEELLELLEELN